MRGITMRRAHALWMATLLTACGGGGSDAGSGSSAPPPPVSDHPACVISADCPAGEHCDLSECVQDCNTQDPCTGEATCSPRARCVAPGQPDGDPKPSAHYAGALDVSPKSARLTDRDTYLDVHLTAHSQDPVRYRVALSGPHLSIDAPRGEFREQTTLRVRVDASALKGRDVAGSIKVFTTLGDALVDAPIHVGVTGAYHGALRYDRDPKLPLGDARIALEILEANGDVAVRVDSKASLLFPPTDAGETTGHGQFTATDGLDFTLSQVIDAKLGGSRNHFRRPVGRKLRFHLKPNADGNLEGTFDEQLVGIFSEPATTTGSVLLQYDPKGADPKFTVADAPPMPPSPSKTTSWGPGDVFGWTTNDCTPLVCGCDGACTCDTTSRLTNVENAAAAPIYVAFSSKQPSGAQSAMPIEDIATSCRTVLGYHSMADVSAQLAPAQRCGLPQQTGCALVVRTGFPITDVDNGIAFGRELSEYLAPELLVAKNEVVASLYDSFSKGLSAEQQHYDDAMAVLDPAATWVLQPSVLETLRSLPPQAAKGPDPSDTNTYTDTYPAARAMADLLYTMSDIDGERARMAAASASGQQASLAGKAQTRALLTYLEVASLAEVLRAWQTAPPSVAARFIGVLTPLDHGFAALTQGANAFGVAPGFVPFVYRPEDVAKGPTNFEQMLAIAADAVGAEKNLETQFVADKRQYEYNEQSLQQQLGAVRAQFDSQIHTICGQAFDPNAITSNDDWARCGDGQSGEIGELGIDIDVAKSKLAGSQSRIRGARDKIGIEVRAEAAKQKIHEQNLQFISSTGDTLSILDFDDSIIAGEESAIQVASNANLFNGGAPLGEAVAMFALSTLRGAIAAQKQQLETAQQMHMEQSNAQIEAIDAAAQIQKDTIDLAQMAVDLEQDQLAILESQVKQRNKLAQAKALFEERRRVLGVLDRDPSNDPSYRLMRDALALQILAARADAQRALYLAGSALEYELNQSLGAVDGAVLNAYNASGLDALSSCFHTIYDQSRIAYGAPQDYVATVWVRQMLGIHAPRKDDVTGETLSEGDQFRALLLKNDNLDGRGGVGITFATDLQPGNQLWAADVCADRIASVQAQLVGDFLGDNQAQVNVSLTGGAVMRACDSDQLVTWSLGGGGSAAAGDVFAVVQAGVNTFGDAPPNTSLFGQSVARASWRVVIPGAQDAPSNADVDLTHVDDIVLKFAHKALPRRSAPPSIDTSCLSQVGGGQ